MNKKNIKYLILTSIVVSSISLYIYFNSGFNGLMHIRNGEIKNKVLSSELFLQANATIGNSKIDKAIPFNLSDSAFSFDMSVQNKETINFSYADYVPNAFEVVREGLPGIKEGTSILELKVVINNKLELINIKDGDIKSIGSLAVAFNNNSKKDAIKISEKDGKLFITSSYDIVRTTLEGKDPVAILMDSVKELSENYIYKTNGAMFAFIKWHKNSTLRWLTGFEGMTGRDIVLVHVNYKTKSYEVPVFITKDNTTSFSEILVDDVKLNIAYGKKEVDIPFYLKLNKFQLNMINGRITNASSLQSDVTLVDSVNNKTINYIIKNVSELNYNGYMIKQSIYDEDQGGSSFIVEVKPTSWVMYIGIVMLVVSVGLYFFIKE